MSFARCSQTEREKAIPQYNYVDDFNAMKRNSSEKNGECRWSLELLREDDRMKEHAKRFDAGGAYEKITLNQWMRLQEPKHERVQF